MGYLNNGSGSITYTLEEGANLFSFPFTTETVQYNTPAKLNTLFDGKIGGIIGEGVAAVINNGTWIGSLKFLDPKKGYWVKTSGSSGFPVTKTISGSLIEENIIDVKHAGANLLSSPYPIPNKIEYALNPTTVGIITSITSEGTSATWNGLTWLGNMTHFLPGGGYWFTANGPIDEIFLPSGSNTTYNVGSTYYPCWPPGHNATGQEEESGIWCNHIGSSNYSGSVFADRHNFGYRTERLVSYHFITGSFNGTASIQDKNGNEMSGNLHVGIFPQAGTASYAVTSFFGKDHSYGSHTLSGSDTLSMKWDGQFYTIDLQISNNDNYGHPLHGPIDTGSGQAQHPDNPNNTNIYPKLGEPLTIQIYDPGRNKVYSASMHYPNGAEYVLSGSSDGQSEFHHLAPGVSQTSTDKVFKYFKLKQ